MQSPFRLFSDCRCTLSESPMWHKAQQKLYWRGFHGEIYRKSYNDDPTDFECFQLNVGNIGSMAFTQTDEILLFADEGKIWRWIPGQEPVLYRKLHSSLFNDCIVDPKGRVFCGMLAENYFDLPNRGNHGWLYRLDPGGPDNKSVFVTTAKENDPVGEHDGGVFVMKNDIAGCEEFLYTI